MTTPPPTEYPPGLPDDVSPLADRAAGTARTLVYILVVAGLVLVVGAVNGPTRRQFFHSYLFGYVFALDVCLGALFWVLIHHVADAGWSVGLRRVYENLTRGLAPLAVLFLPVLVGIYTGNLHGWYEFVSGAEPAAGTHEHHQWHVKQLYFSPAFFLARVAIYFAVWLVYSSLMRRLSARQDAEGGAALTRRMQWWAPSGLLLLGLTSTFFAIDLLMSLQYTWFSTIYGVYFWAGGLRGSLAAAVLVVLALRAGGHLRHTITVEHLHDAAKLTFGLTVFWAYIAFSQYFLIWYGNIPAETNYYLSRRNGGWYTASVLLPLLNFALPFALLLPRACKRNLTVVGLVAAWVLLMHAYDLYWQVLPVLHTDTVRPHWLDVAAPVFTAAVVAAAALHGLRTAPLIPVRDARLNETIGYENETP